MPPVSSVLEKCVVGKEGGNESQPVGGLCEGHRTRRAGKFSISILLQFRKSQCLLTCSYINIRYAKLFFIFNTSSIVFNN